MPSVTPADVLAFSGKTVSATDVSLATALVEDNVGVDLSGTTSYLPRDLARLCRAVMWQALHLAANPTALTAQPGVVSASANGASITYAPGTVAADLSPLAERALAGLSWRSRLKTMLPAHASDRSRLSQDLVHDEGRQPWVPLS